MNILPLSYFENTDTLALARDLLGKSLFTRIDGHLTGGVIIETEAYLGTHDKACHAYNGCRTKRTEVMYQTGGVAYIYLCYGMHHLFNIVTHQENEPHAILIRALLPTRGLDTMRKRRGKKDLTSGPAMVAQALGLTLAHSGTPLNGQTIWVEDGPAPQGTIVSSPRIGIAYAEEFALKPWRFQLISSHL